MNVLTEKELLELASIMKRHIGVLLYIATGKGKPDPKLLKTLGIPEKAADLIQNSFILGKILKLMNDQDLKKVTIDELKEKAKDYSLTAVEKNSLDFAKENAARYVTALGQRIDHGINGQILQISHDSNLAAAQRKTINDTVQEAIRNQQTRGKLASELGHNIGDWKRDWQRVSHTEIWNAKLQGEVTTIIQGQAVYSGADGADSNVFRRPSADACAHCKRLLLETDGVTPKVFKLSELIANGTNVGRKTAEWEPITGVIHPNCTCPIAVLPDGFGFDSTGNLEFKG